MNYFRASDGLVIDHDDAFENGVLKDGVFYRISMMSRAFADSSVRPSPTAFADGFYRLSDGMQVDATEAKSGGQLLPNYGSSDAFGMFDGKIRSLDWHKAQTARKVVPPMIINDEISTLRDAEISAFDRGVAALNGWRDGKSEAKKVSDAPSDPYERSVWLLTAHRRA